jgi:hypothetical protein
MQPLLLADHHLSVLLLLLLLFSLSPLPPQALAAPSCRREPWWALLWVLLLLWAWQLG